MGFLTNVSINNDFWHIIERDPQGLVDAIRTGMNYGLEGPMAVVFHERDMEDGDEIRLRNYFLDRREIPQGVTVHKAQHYDFPQVIVNPRGSHAVAAHEIPSAIYEGWLKGGAYRRELAMNTVKELRDLADRIEREIEAKDGGVT